MAPESHTHHAGRFITFEGGEGAGKSTQVKALAARLRAQGLTVVETREPGGVPSGELIRDLLVTGATDRWTPLSEALLNYAARQEHLEELIRPTLARAQWVISDRFADSTTAYQGSAEGVAPDVLKALYELVVGNTSPNLTFMLDIPANEGLKRAEARGTGGTRYEQMGVAYHQRIREAFLLIARNEPQRCKVIDGTLSADDVGTQVWDAVKLKWGAEFGVAVK
jgi:dTMP kinase